MSILRADHPIVDGIHRCLSPERAAHYERFLAEYTGVRLAEGRASADPEYFRRLPEPTPGGPIEWQWRIRRNTWRTFRRRVLPGLPARAVVVDVGAGVGWLSNRLAELGHDARAVDLTIDPDDGLGAARHFLHPFARYQAEMDDLPFADGVADMVVFNAALHYSTDYALTLAEALRVLKPTGRVVVLETPLYRADAAGRAMVAERHTRFEQQYGTRSEAIASIEYLTPQMLDALASQLSLRWRFHRTWYGWSWAMRPWKARWHRKRPPSRFVVMVARRA
ncbi:MAG: class I SAM-dependent methyltransferase [Actinomycetota bacterium]